MKICKNGVTRTVFIFNGFVVKFPTFKHGYKMFLSALLYNIAEGVAWNHATLIDNGSDKLLCPVIWYSRTGLVLIMKKADVDKHCEEIGDRQLNKDYAYYNKWHDVHHGGDDKPENYGYYEDRLVKVDYGNIQELRKKKNVAKNKAVALQ